jgi:hypothetical protein
VGMFADWTYQEGSVQLEPGDLFLAYTDGVVEAEPKWRGMGDPELAEGRGSNPRAIRQGRGRHDLPIDG